MRSEWPLVKIDELKALHRSSVAIGPFGSRLKSDRYTVTGVPVIRGTNLTGGRSFSGDWVYVSEETANELANCNVFGGDLVFPHRGAIGEVGIVPFDDRRYLLSTSLMKLSCDRSKADPLYLYYFFKSKQGRHELLKHASQVGTPGIGQPLTSLRGIEVPLPPLEFQKTVSDILGTLDDKIELNRQINRTLEEIAQALFKSWFVDFEPVLAKIAAKEAGRDPLRAAMSAISGKAEEDLDELPREQYEQLAATAALFPDEMVGSELGEIPRGWEVSTIGREVTVLGGSTPSTKNPAYWDGPYAWVTPKDLSGSSDRVLITSERTISRAGVDQISSGQLPVGTVLLSSRAPIGYLALAKIPVSINQGFIAMVCDKRLPNTYVLQWTAGNLDGIKQRAGGTTFAEISKGNFRPMSVLVPGDPVLHAYQATAEFLYDDITVRLRESRTLAALRDALLPKLLSGKIRVSKAERIMETV